VIFFPIDWSMDVRWMVECDESWDGFDLCDEDERAVILEDELNEIGRRVGWVDVGGTMERWNDGDFLCACMLDEWMHGDSVNGDSVNDETAQE